MRSIHAVVQFFQRPFHLLGLANSSSLTTDSSQMLNNSHYLFLLPGLVPKEHLQHIVNVISRGVLLHRPHVVMDDFHDGISHLETIGQVVEQAPTVIFGVVLYLFSETVYGLVPTFCHLEFIALVVKPFHRRCLCLAPNSVLQLSYSYIASGFFLFKTRSLSFVLLLHFSDHILQLRLLKN